MKLIPAILASVAHEGAQRLTRLARKLSPGLPPAVYVSTDRWCYLPDSKRLVLSQCSIPEEVRSLYRYLFVTLAVVEQPDGEPAALFLYNGNETPYVMWGREPDGFPMEGEEEQPPADMDALIRAALSLNKNFNSLN